MALLYGRGGRLTAQNGGFRSGQFVSRPVTVNLISFALFSMVAMLSLFFGLNLVFTDTFYSPGR
jgi:hypothetical protein